MRAYRLLALLLLTSAMLAGFSDAALAIQDTNVAVSKVTPSSAVLVVKTDAVSDVTVDYGNSPGVYASTRSGTGAGRHEITLDGLASSSTVYYRVTITASGNPADSLVLAEKSFSSTKAPGIPFSFGVVGDNRPAPNNPINPPPVWSTLVGMMAGENLDFVLHSGDIVESAWEETAQLNETKYDAFFLATKLLTASAPLYTAVGNHEGIKFPANRAGYEREFTLPVNNGAAAATDGEEYYSFDNGDTHFIVLCTEIPGDQALIKGDQLTWLEQDLQAASSNWTAVTVHRPFFSGTHTLDPWLNPSSLAGQANKSALLSLFQQYGVDVVFEGHDHYYQHHVDNGIQFVITGGGGSPLYDLPLFGPGDIFGAKVYHYLKVDETADSFAVTAIDAAGSQLESFTLGSPALTLSQGLVYWGSLPDYEAGLLSVDFILGNNGPGDAEDARLVYLSSSNGVTPYTGTPVILGNLSVTQSATTTVQYLVPPGVSFFRASTYVTCSDLAGAQYAFPGPAPVF